MKLLVALLYAIAVGLLVLAGLRIKSRASLALLGAAAALLAYSLPAIDAGLVG